MATRRADTGPVTPAREAVEKARGQVAHLLGCASDEVVFTSGGSEANNHALKGVAFALRDKGDHIVTSAVEHPAVLNPCAFLEKLGYRTTVLPVDRIRTRRSGRGSHARSRPERSSSASCMPTTRWARSSPSRRSAASRAQRGILLHTDAAQSVGKIPTRVDDLGVDLLIDCRPQALCAERCRRALHPPRDADRAVDPRRRSRERPARRDREARS